MTAQVDGIINTASHMNHLTDSVLMFLLKLESQLDLILFMHVVGTVLLTVIAVYLHQHQGDNEQHYHHYIGKHHSSFQGNPIKNYNFIYINITYIHI